MGRTLASGTQQFLIEQQYFEQFRRALLRPDQLVLDDLFSAAHNHIAAISAAADALPMETILLAMLLEEHKKVMHLQSILERQEKAKQA
jgi:hypothetical protein